MSSNAATLADAVLASRELDRLLRASHAVAALSYVVLGGSPEAYATPVHEAWHISIYGKPPEDALSLIGYVPQAMHFDKQFPISVYELVLSGRLSRLPWYGIYSQEDHKAALDALICVELEAFANVPFGNLSGGQAQRALIARALASHPKILLLDEPTANVDAKAENYIYAGSKELESKMTILMVTHDLNAVIEQVQRVLCVQKNVVELLPEQVCEHFVFGLYHKPLLKPGES